MTDPAKIRILIACECSGRIREAFAARGFDAWSCDLKPTETPGNHLQADIFTVLDQKWDAMIAHPECRYLCFSGERWMTERPERVPLRNEAFAFFKKLSQVNIPFIALENSHSIFLNREYGRPTQTVHPYHFGDPFKKATCFWLKGFPALMPTDILPIGQRHPAAWLEAPGKNRSENRARTYPGLASAVAKQWGDFLINKIDR